MPLLLTDPHKLATAGLVHYSGDISPLNYGGTWYDSSTWEKECHASAIEVYVLDDGPKDGLHLVVSLLTIHKPENMVPAFECCGVLPSEYGNIRAQIEACQGYGHFDRRDWREPPSYSFVLPDNNPETFQDYCRIHGCTVSDADQVWELLNRLVGRELRNGVRL